MYFIIAIELRREKKISEETSERERSTEGINGKIKL